MRRPYVTLLLVILGLAVALTIVGRLHRGGGVTRPETPAGPRPSVAITIEVKDGAIDPREISVPKDHEVRLTVINHDPKIARITLSGYEDRVSIPPLAPRDHWLGSFLADRPGEDFAWVLNGEPAGRFGVTGQHLIEGHR